MVLEETQNMPAGKDSFQPPVGENRQLVDILSAHNLKRLDCGGVGRDCPELTEGPHHRLHTRLFPEGTVHMLDLIWSN